MKGLLKINELYPELMAIENSIKENRQPILVSGVSGSQKTHLMYSVAKRLGKKLFVISATDTLARVIYEDIRSLEGTGVSQFTSKEYIFYDVDVATTDEQRARIETINGLEDGFCVVSSVKALMQYTVCKDLYLENTMTLSVGDSIDMKELVVALDTLGYKRVYSIEGMGQYSVRGSIVDVFSSSSDNPCRIEFFGDEIDSLRIFDMYTQMSLDMADKVQIYPVKELLTKKDTLVSMKEKVLRMKNENLLSDAEKLREGESFLSLDKYLPMIYETLPTLFDYMNDEYLLFVDDPQKVLASAKEYEKEFHETIVSFKEKGLFPKCKGDYILSVSGLIDKLSTFQSVYTNSVSHSVGELKIKEIVNLTAKTLPSYNGKTGFLIDDLDFWLKNNYRIVILLSTDSRIKSVKDALDESGIESVVKKDLDTLPENAQIFLCLGGLSHSFEYPSAKTVVLSDSSLFNTPKKRLKRRSQDPKSKIRSFDELSIGDYVVHRFHGIGQYAGIEKMTVDGVTKDYIKINYRGSDKLYVPTNQLDVLHKYMGAETGKMKLNKLGGTEWGKTTSKVKESVKILATSLIDLYAERSRIQGHTFSEDTPWQLQFESDFPYEETKDQLTAISDVKSDMEKGKCMDRLLCGDVGYGKTEIALRAAFKTVMEGMQVAYLVPTTILCQQHFNTFTQRMSDYAIEVDMLSRFRTKSQQNKTVSALKSGRCDVIIGTHRLLSKDIDFKNLGLLIIDEEQRFGVGHKEKIKELKKSVNVLTLSATPIPRTLNMAMMGIRDLSVLSEPPENRYPVQTFVMEKNDTVIQNAIDRELSRNGQVFYLYNRVEGISHKAKEIQDMFPDKVVRYAHGQMSENELEEIMMELIDGEIDILICTTIIETGLDVSNVNTIIIENAERLGLSQLYQLRGRVGRSSRLAYAYLMYEKNKVLDQTAQKRLTAIKEFTEFGSGFKIAMRDLEIRGAGNLLGKEQHGNMNLVGYDMYCMLLSEAVSELKGEKVKPKLETQVSFQLDAFIPSEYIKEEKTRLEIYKKIATISTEEDIMDMSDELIDRFGDFSLPVKNLIDIAYIKNLASVNNITEITQKDGFINFTLDDNISPKAICEVMAEKERKIMFTSGEVSYLCYKYDKDILSNVKIILQKLSKAAQMDDNDI